MARKGKSSRQHRKVNDEQAEKRFEENLDRLAELCEDYDRGRIRYALPIAVEIHKLLAEGGGYSTRRRGTVKFPGPAIDDDPNNLMAHYLLVTARFGNLGNGPEGTHRHSFDSNPAGLRWQKFRDWWNETAFRASAAMPGDPPGLIPINGHPSMPFAKRERLKRREMVAMMRNHAGAHDSGEYPLILDEVDHPGTWGHMSVQNDDGTVFSTEDGTLQWNAGPLASSMRQIAEEVLIAFGRAQPPKSRDFRDSLSPQLLEDDGRYTLRY